MALQWWLACLALGAFAGTAAGLLGIGGGLIIVPALTMLFAAQSSFPPAEILHLALGTSMATIMFTSISSLRAHHRHGAVLWPVVLQITPGILVGTALGTLLATRIPARPPAIFFAVFVCFVALQMFLGLKPKASRDLPGKTGTFAVGIGIGAVSSLVAIGGGAMSVPFLTWCNVRVQNAIGTSAAIGFPIAVGGTIGYIYNGIGHPGLPGWSLGYVHLPVLLVISSASMLMAPLGARLAHRLPVPTLKRIFACLLIVLAGKMVASLFT